MSAIIVADPMAMSGRTSCGGDPTCPRTRPPNTMTMIIGAMSIILASGARVSDRIAAAATADAYSDAQGNFRSTSLTFFGSNGLAGLGVADFVAPPDVNCPV